jgi:ribosome biogenesis protein BRX1
MASVFKAQIANAARSKGKRRADSLEDDGDDDYEDRDVDVRPKTVMRNKQRVLMLSSRGITHRMRHLMNDLEALLPHVKKGAWRDLIHFYFCATLQGTRADSKLDSKSQLHLLPELADLHNCNNALYFEARRYGDLYLWAAKMPNGPSIKLHVQNVHTMDELRLSGNCLRGSRGVVSFDAAFDETAWGALVKEVFTHVSPLFGGRMALTKALGADFWRTVDSETGQAFYRPCTDVFVAR